MPGRAPWPGTLQNNEYRNTNLDNGSWLVHILVALCFTKLASLTEYHEVDHISGIKVDNKADNLKPLTRREHLVKHGAKTLQ